MKERKLPYIHILPRILIGVLVFGVLLFLIYVPMISHSILTVGDLADTGTPLPTDTPIPSAVVTPSPSPSPTPTRIPTIAPSPGPTRPPADEVSISAYTTLRLGDDNASVVHLQQRLTDLGYLDSDMPESTFTETIQSAVMLFQRACDREQTGIADADTQTMLYENNAQSYRMKRSDTGKDVLRLQERLSELGYYTERVNGYYGPHTEQAVMHFQAVNELTVSGELDYTAWGILYSDEAIPIPALPTDTPTPEPTATAPGWRATAKATKKATAKTKAKTTARTKATPKATDKKRSTGKKTYRDVVSAAQDQLGKPYEWGAEGPGSFDCSGLVYYCLKQSGHSVSRQNAASYSKKSGWKLITSMKDLKAGDLVFFKSDSKNSVNHTGIVISSNTMIHASSGKGKVVRSSLNQSYWERNFVCGRRPS